MIYFIRAKHSGNFKIGYTSHAPERRLATLQTGCFEPLSLVGSIPGGMDDEKALHARFAAHRLHGEWFAPAEEVAAGIQALLSPPDAAEEYPPQFAHSSRAFGPDDAAPASAVCCPCCGGPVRSVETRADEESARLTFDGDCGCYWSLHFAALTEGVESWIEVLQDCRPEPFAGLSEPDAWYLDSAPPF